jgi:aminocarboxymuconate-semialdehyde decarboxylase
MTTTSPVIDVHAHAVLEGTMGTAGDAGPELGGSPDAPWFRVGGYVLQGVRYRGSAFMDADVRLAAMDAHGIDRQLLSPNPLTFFTRDPAPRVVDYCRAHNDELAGVVAAHPDRFLGAAQLPMQDVAAATSEIQRATQELGLTAAYIDTDPGGRALDDPALDDFYACLVEADVPLFVHPTSIGDGGPPDDPRLRRFDLDLLLGFAYQETLAVAALVFGGVLERHPDLDVCLSHGGGAIQTLMGRFGRAADKRAWASETLRREGFTAMLSRLWFDTHLHSDIALAGLAEVVGTERLVYGTNFAGWDADGPGEFPHVDPVVLSDNASRLLRLAV